MRTIITGDGSPTLHNDKYGEAYHCTRGAVAEAVGKYAEPCRVAETAYKNGRLRIMDVCFGLGYNAWAAIDAVSRAAPQALLDIVGLEKDPAALQAIAGLDPALPHYGLIKALAAAPGGMLQQGNVNLRLVLGDATQTVTSLDGPFDVVFHDPFSPRKNPEMWTAGFFGQVYELMPPGGVLATYSCARQVRDNLRSAGFSVSDGPVLNRRAPGTLAHKKG